MPTSSSRFFNWEDLEQKIRLLFMYFAVAEKQGWVDARNFALLRDEYRKLYATVREITPSSQGTVLQKLDSEQQHPLSARQAKILGFLQGKIEGEAISDIAKIIGASNKTAERELKKFISARRVRKQGNTKGARFIIDKEV